MQLVCPANAGTIGCAVYFTGDDVTALYNQGGNQVPPPPPPPPPPPAQTCESGAEQGAIQGAITGVFAIGDCLDLAELAPFCIAEVIGVRVALEAAEGCATSCFPGNSTTSPLPR
jgi:hypothetical protein